MIVVLTGGTGGAKLIEGLAAEIDPSELTIICNTGDDCFLHGLHISPDIDTITYTLAGLIDDVRGWGIKGDTFTTLERLGRLGADTWFRVGDRDLATHITRTRLLREGRSLSQVTEHVRKSLGVKATILPMSDDRVETRVVTPGGEISFQEFFVKERWSLEVNGIRLVGAEQSRPAPGVLETIGRASAVIVCPSNPITSIGPILAVPGIRSALMQVRAPVIGVSPIIGASAISGPAHKLMAAMGMEQSAFGVARAYADFLDTFIIDTEDATLKNQIEALGINVMATSIRMRSLSDKICLAHAMLTLIE